MIKNKRLTLEISFSSILTILLVVGSIYLFSQLSDIVILLFTSILISLAICPLVDKFDRHKISRPLSTGLVLLSFFIVIVLFGISLVTPLIDQTEAFIAKLPQIIETVSPVKFDINNFSNQISGLSGNVINIAIGTFSSLLNILTLFVLTFYITQEMHRLPEYFEAWFDHKGKLYYSIAEKLEEQVGYWVRGEIILMVIVGLLNYIGFLAIGLPYAIPLAFIAGVLELVPNIGPVVATIPAMFVGFSISTTHGIASMIVSLLVQQLENNLIVPKVMQKVTGLSPVITILAIMIGLRLGGPLLAVLAIPTVLATRVIFAHLQLNKKTSLPELD